MLVWTTTPPERGWLRDHGYAVLPWSTLLSEFVMPARTSGTRQRASLVPPASALVERFRTRGRVALLDVYLRDADALRTLHDYVLRPAHVTGCRLVVHADWTLDQLNADTMVEALMDEAFTLERARHLTDVMSGAIAPKPDPGPPAPSRPLDPEQLAAIAAGEGVVQIIAPAGSGKTTVLVERVRELLRRGTPPDRILCATFNAAAAAELRVRLATAGVAKVQARTFHSLGRTILAQEQLLPGETRTLTLPQWRRLSAMANKSTGTWVDPGEARAAISQIKLAHLATAAEWSARRLAAGAPRTVAAIYDLYERQMREQGAHDFDDQILLSVRALRTHHDLRARWQCRFTHVLVDEYQDIEPAQELLVQILAAPEDALFCVGDEDQTLYGWRRASVMRMVGLDQAYPSLERVALATNYRCPPRVVTHSAELLAHNALRFPKTINPAPGKPDDAAAISLDEHPSPEAAADWAARELAVARRGEIVVLARTTRLLRTVALACIGPQVRISAPPAVFEARGAQAALEAHLRLATAPSTADPEDVLTVLRSPARGLASDAEHAVAERLRQGASWTKAVAGHSGRNGDDRLDDAATKLDELAAETDARRFVRTLRGPFGLDQHFAEHERTFGGAEQTETEALADAERQAAGLTVTELAERLTSARQALLALRDDEHGVELSTVHGAKGREWPTVIVFGFDKGQMPHEKALEVDAALVAAGEGEQAERRVAYVAMTRAIDRLHVLHTKGKMSPFAWQSGLAPKPKPAARPQQRTPTSPRSANRSRSPARGSRSERRAQSARARPPSRRDARDARDIIRDAPDRPSGLTLAARAVEGKLGDCAKIALEDLLVEAPSMSRKRARAILDGTGASLDTRTGHLDATTRARVVGAILAAAGEDTPRTAS